MAGDWIKMRSNLDTNPHVIGIAAQLGIPELYVVGLLWKVWSWADTHTIDGNAIRVTDVTLDRFTGVTGFAAALRKVGWLEGRDNALSFPRFAEHNGQTAKNRAETAVRVAKHRNAKPVTNVTQKTLPEKRREEKRREEDNKPTSTQETPAPLGFRPLGEMSLNSFFDNPETRRLLTLWGQTAAIDEIRADFALSKSQGQGWDIAKINRSIEKSAMAGWRELYDPDAPRGKPAKDYS